MAIREDYRKLFEEHGLEAVRTNIATGLYNAAKAKSARAWVEEQEHAQADEASRRKDTAVAEQLEISRSAKDAAWKSAHEAEHANLVAKRANQIAIASIVIAILSAALAIFY